MSQPIVSNAKMNGTNPSSAKDQSTQNCDRRDETQQQKSQPTVRHIPIFVEGRDEPLLNKNVERSPSDAMGGQRQPSPTVNDLPKPGFLYNRVKDIPVRKHMSDLQATPQNAGRAGSPSRTIPIVVHTTSQNDTQAHSAHPQPQRQYQKPTPEQPQVQRSNSKMHSVPIKVEHTTIQKDTSRGQANQQHPLQHQQHPQSAVDEVDSKSPQKPSPAVQQSLDAITKIQKIQQDVLELMNRVEQYEGGSRTDKDYLYLDEMLTQNLLKLDTIDAEGKDNIKAARKEAIKCINKCISVLEAKTDPANNSTSNSQIEANSTKANGSERQVANS